MSGEERTLAPIEQKEVEFYGDELTAFRTSNGRVYASLRHMCDALGLNARGQSQRIDRHTVLSRGKGVCKIHTPGGEQSIVALRVDLVPLWLAGVRTNMVNEEVREKLEKFQEEAADVLWEAFQEGRLTADPTFEELLQNDSEAVQAYQIATAVVKLARQQILMEARLAGRLDDHEQRLEQIEAALGDSDRFITPSQAMQISQAVKAVAREIGQRAGKNEHGGVYGELYRKFEIVGYKQLPAERFQEAIDWLTEWHKHESDTPRLPF